MRIIKFLGVLILLLVSHAVYAQEIYDYIYEGDLAGVKKYIENGTDVNDQGDEFGWTVLMAASNAGKIEIVKYLVINGADINIIDKSEYGASALKNASSKGYLDIVKYLVVNGADVNLQVNNGSTALMSASALGDIGIVKYLVVNDADVNIQNYEGTTALVWASSTKKNELKSLEIIKYLIENGADVNLHNKEYGSTALYWASTFGYLETVKYLKSKGAK